MPLEILSDRGKAFLSGLVKEVERLLGFHKVNTSAYHSQTDGLVERFNCTLTSMLTKTVERGGKDWDQYLTFVLFSYRVTQQQSTQESPFLPSLWEGS
jgi:transposase InsO family protein